MSPHFDLTKPWTVYPFVVIDFETTGVDPATAEPVSVGAVRYEGGVEVAHLHSLLKPNAPIPAEASAIHGITDEMVKEAVRLPDLAHDLSELCRGAIPVAYHAAYDRPILHRYIRHNDCPALDVTQLWLCALVVIRDVDRYVKGAGRHKLEATCKRWEVELDGAHNALADCRGTGRLLVQLRRADAIAECSLGNLLAHIERRRVQQEADFAAYRERMARNAAAAEQTKLPMDGT